MVISLPKDEDEFLGLKLAKENEEKKASLLDKESEEYRENADDGYISPFDDNYYSPPDEEEEEEDLQAIELRESRVKTYCLILLSLYLLFLGYGWYMTSYKGSSPQILTFDIRTQQVYMERMDEYILSVQNLYSEGYAVVEQFEGKTLGNKEAITKLQKVSGELQKKKEELSGVTAPPSLESFHNKLNETYSIAMAFCSAAEAYIQNPTEVTAQKTNAAVENYMNASAVVNREYDKFFSGEK